jgi:hypothetical protein
MKTEPAGARVKCELVLVHERYLESIAVSPGAPDARVVTLPRLEITFRPLAGKFVDFGGERRPVVEVDMPAALAKQRKLAAKSAAKAAAS